MAAPSQGTVFGWEFAQVWKRGTNGRAYGTAGQGATAPATTHALVFEDVINAQPPQPQRVVAQRRGGNKWRGQYMFGITELGAFDMTVQDLNGTLDALLTGGAVDNTWNTRWQRGSVNTFLGRLPQMGLMLSAPFQSSADGSDGSNYWIHYVLLNCQIDVTLPQMNFQTAGERTLRVTPSASDRDLTGEAISSSANMKQSGGKAWMYWLTTDYPVHITTHLSATGTDTFNLFYKPVGSTPGDSTPAVDTTNLVYKNGAAATVTTITPATGAVALTGLDADEYVLLYEHNFEKVA